MCIYLLGCHSWMECLAAKLFLNSYFSDTVIVTLFRTAVETAISEVHKLLRTSPPYPLPPPLLPVPNKPYGFCGR